jgi:hypothetical protein
MPAFILALRNPDGSRADPERFESAVPNWKPGDVVYLSPTRRYRVVDTAPHPTLHATLVVEPA